MTTLTDISQASCEYISFNMREMDAIEIFARRPHDNPYQLAFEMMATFRQNGRARIAWHNGKPAALVGFAEYWPGVWQIGMMGTDDFRNVAIDCLRWVRETAADLIANHGGRRLQCYSHEDHHEAHRFLTRLGARIEGEPMQQFGKDGRAFYCFVWIAGQNDHIIRKAA